MRLLVTSIKLYRYKASVISFSVGSFGLHDRRRNFVDIDVVISSPPSHSRHRNFQKID